MADLDNAVDMMSDAARGESPKRLVGTLAAGEVLAGAVHPEEIINVQGADSIAVRAEVTTVTGSPEIRLHPLRPKLGGGFARATAGAPSAVVLAADVEGIIEYTLKGERYLEVELDDGGGCTITHVDVYVRP